MSKELDDAYFRSTPCTHHEPLLGKLVDCVDLLEDRIKGLLGAKVYVGDTDTLPAGSEAMVSASKHGYDTMLEFGIPRGRDGSDAEATDVRVAGKSITADGVADIPVIKGNSDTAADNSYGVVKSRGPAYGIWIDNGGLISTDSATKSDINKRDNYFKPITSAWLDYAVKAAMCDGKGAAWTADEQKAARERMNAADAEKVYIMQKQIENLQGIAATEETDTTEAYTKTVPTGAQKWASIDKVGGKTVVNAGELVSAEVVEVESKGKNLFDLVGFAVDKGAHVTQSGDTIRVTPTSAMYGEPFVFSEVDIPVTISAKSISIVSGTNPRVEILRKDGSTACGINTSTLVNSASGSAVRLNWSNAGTFEYEGMQIERGTTATPYSPYGIKGTFQIPAEVRDMCPGYGWSAGTVCNEIDFERKKYVQRVGSVDLGIMDWTRYSNGRMQAYAPSYPHANNSYDLVTNCACSKYVATSAKVIESSSPVDKTVALGGNSNTFAVYDSDYTDANAFKEAMSGVLLYYELATPIEVDLSGVLTDDHFIEVEAGGTVTFKQASTQLPVPSSVTYQISTSEVIANA